MNGGRTVVWRVGAGVLSGARFMKLEVEGRTVSVQHGHLTGSSAAEVQAGDAEVDGDGRWRGRH